MTAFMLLTAALLGSAALSIEEEAAARLDGEIRSAAGFRQIRAAEYRRAPQPDFPVAAGDPGIRIGQYRVRAAAGQSGFAERIRRAALDAGFPARAHALEAAAKLNLQFPPAGLDILRKTAKSSNELEAAYAVWVLAANGDETSLKRLIEMVDSTSPVRNMTGAYAGGYLPELSGEYEAALRRAAAAPETQCGSFALWSLARHRRLPPDALRRSMTVGLPEKVLRYHLLALGECGGAQDLSYLGKMLRSPEPETANAAAAAILLISQRNPPH